MTRRGPYLLLEELSRTEWSVLFKAKLEDESRQLLLKALIRPAEEEWLQRLTRLQEVTPCPNLRTPLSVQRDQEGTFLVLPWLPGPSLEQLRASQVTGTLPLRQALCWVADALRALSHLHGLGLLHGDIKPSNLLLNESQEAVLVDLGSLLTIDHPVPGPATEAYLIPDPQKRASVQRDLYATGLTLAALISGRLPPSGPNRRDWRLSKVDPLVPPAVDDLLSRALGFSSPFADARSMLSQVEQLLGEKSDTDYGTSPPTRRVEIPQARGGFRLWPVLVVMACLPLGMVAAHFFKPAPVGAPLSVVERTGIDFRQGNHQGREVWQTTVLGRPIAGFAGPDPAVAEPSARSRAEWTAAVLTQGLLDQRVLRFEYRHELPEQSEVWLSGDPPIFLFRVTATEQTVFQRSAPELARRWTRLIQDTVTLLGAQGTPGNSAGVLLLRPWRARAETLAGGRSLSGPERITTLKEAFSSLKPESQEEILTTYAPEEEKE